MRDHLLHCIVGRRDHRRIDRWKVTVQDVPRFLRMGVEIIDRLPTIEWPSFSQIER